MPKDKRRGLSYNCCMCTGLKYGVPEVKILYRQGKVRKYCSKCALNMLADLESLKELIKETRVLVKENTGGNYNER